MNRRLSILFIFMLIFQMVSGSVVLPVQTLAEGNEPKDTIFGTESEIKNEDAEVTAYEVPWSVVGVERVKESYTLQLTDEVTFEETTGELVEGAEVGTYDVSADGEVTVNFAEDLEGHEDASGTILVEVVVEKDETLDEPKISEKSVMSAEGADEAGNEEDEDINKETSEDELDALAEEREPQAITENIIDELKLLRKDETEFEDGELIEVDEDLRFELDWSIPNDHEYKNGDYFEFQLPKQLQVYNELTGDLGEYGSYVVTIDGKVTFTFNKNIEDNSNVNGEFWIDTELDEREIKSTTEELEIIFNDDVAKKITINVKPTGGQAIHKEGQPVDGNFNTEEIEWTVLVNTTRDALENAIVNDPIFEGLELITDSIVLQEVEVDISGNVTKELDEVKVFTNNSTPEELNIALGDTNKAYKLTFRTKMKEDEKDNEGWKNYLNTAYLNSDGQGEKQSGASVSVNRPKSMEKTSTAFDKESRSVEWEVKANFNEKNLKQGEAITDEFTFTVGDEDFNDIFEIIEADITIEQVDEFDSNGNVKKKSDAKDLFDINIEGNKVTYTLKEDTDKAFVLNYKTQAKDGKYITDDGKIVNKVDLNGKTSESGQGVIQQVGKKTNAGINYEDKTIDWTITINADKQDLRNFVLIDDFAGSGQKLVEDSIKIEPDSGATITPNDDGEGFEIDFGDITDTYTIKYTTEFTYDFEGKETPNFYNGVNISYTTSDGGEYDLEIGNDVKPNKETKSNGAKNGKANNDTKEITWTVDINYNQLKLSEAKMKDAIADNQSLIDDSVKIYETTIGTNGNIVVGDDVTEEFKVTSGENQVDVDFGAIDQSYRVEFVTKDKDGVYNSDEVYENTAQFIPREGEKHNLTANVTLPNQGEFLGKKGLHNKADWTVDWTIDVNKSNSQLTDVTVKDDLGGTDVQILLEDSIKVTKVGSDGALVEGIDYNLKVDGNELIVHFRGEITDHYVITYSSYIVAEDDAAIKNEAEIESVDEVIVGSTEKTETVQVKISSGGGTGQGETGSLVIEKAETGTERALEGVAFNLVKTVGTQDIVVREGTTNAEGKLEWKGLKFGDYTLNEVIPEGYLGEEKQTVTISSDDPEGVKTLEIKNERQTGTAKLIKVDAVTEEKLAGAEFEITNQITGQTYTFTTDKNGEISEKVPFGEYTVEEITAPNGYRNTEDIDNITVEIDKTTEIEVTNEAIVEVAGQKTWLVDEGNDLPEEITVQLLANGKEVASQPVTESNDWKYSFKDLDKYDAEGKEIEYSIEEVELDGYVSEKDGYNLTNIQTINLSGEKTWVEVDSQYRPESITVNLLANGEKVDDEKVSPKANDEWTFEFTNLPKFDSEGEKIKYTIKEEDVTGYTSEIEDFNITNTQETTKITGEKTWIDNDDATEERPESITVQVMNGEEVVQDQEVKANDDDEWNYTFTDLPKYDKAGKEIAYTVEEIVPEGYEATVDGNNITNLRVGTTEVEVSKSWKDEQETDRPETIKVNLLQNGEFYEEYQVTKENDWKLTITDLPKFDEEGVAYEYTVKEHDVPGYAAEVDGFDITNTRADIKTIELSKTWLDNDDATDDRPESIEVDLFRSITDGEKELVETFILTKEDNWSLEVKDLPAFDKDGKAYTYEINEKDVNGYESEVNGFDITNLRVGTTSVEGTKTWEGDNASDRPSSIIVELLQNGEKINEVKVTAETDWKYSFTDLPEFDENGVAYVYTVAEQEVAGYTTTVEGYDITNTLTPVTPESEDPADGGNLPSTATNIFNLMLIGFGLIGIGLVSFFIRRRKAA